METFKLPKGIRVTGDGLPLTSTKVFQPRNGETQREFKHGAEDAEFFITGTRREMGTVVNIPQRHVVHSPTGFEWGYGGSGPADLALNILALVLPAPEAWRLHMPYKFDVIARLARDHAWQLSLADVIAWVRAYWSTETVGAND